MWKTHPHLFYASEDAASKAPTWAYVLVHGLYFVGLLLQVSASVRVSGRTVW